MVTHDMKRYIRHVLDFEGGHSSVNTRHETVHPSCP